MNRLSFISSALLAASLLTIPCPAWSLVIQPEYLLAAHEASNTVVRIDVTTGEQTVVANAGSPSGPKGIEARQDGQIFIADSGTSG